MLENFLFGVTSSSFCLSWYVLLAALLYTVAYILEVELGKTDKAGGLWRGFITPAYHFIHISLDHQNV